MGMQPYTPHGDSNLVTEYFIVLFGCNLIPLTGTVTRPDRDPEAAGADATLYPSRGQ